MSEAGSVKVDFLEDAMARLNTEGKAIVLRIGRIDYHEKNHQNSPTIACGQPRIYQDFNTKRKIEESYNTDFAMEGRTMVMKISKN